VNAYDPPSRDAIFEALWRRVDEAWADDRAHAALLEHAARTQALPELAGRYRALLGDPARGEIAQKRLDAIVAAATQLLFSQKTPKPGNVPLPLTLSVFGICVFMLAWLAWAVWGRR
jgi:hypothetical protein